MPTNKIKENNSDIKNDYYQNIDLQETIKNAKSLLERLNNGEYQGLVKMPILEPINLENGNKEGENKEIRPTSKTTIKYQEDISNGRPNMYIPHISIMHIGNGSKIE